MLCPHILKKRGQGAFVFMKHIYRFFVRMILGMALIFFLNQVFESIGIDLSVGYNVVSVAATGTLGVPGVLLLYGISGCRFL